MVFRSMQQSFRLFIALYTQTHSFVRTYMHMYINNVNMFKYSRLSFLKAMFGVVIVENTYAHCSKK